MRSGMIHQRDARPPAPAQAVAESGRKFESRRAAAHDDDLAQRLVVWGRVKGHRRHLRQVARQPIAPASRDLVHVE
jgi:hypothetical protein